MTGAAIAGPQTTGLVECLPVVAPAGTTVEETRP